MTPSRSASKTRSTPAARKVARERAIFDTIRRVDAACDRSARIHSDPVGHVRRYTTPADLEIAGLVGACLAFGNVKALRAKVADAFDRLGPSPARAADDELGVFAALDGWKHRVYRGEDVARLVIGARRIQRSHGSLERCFTEGLARHGELRAALSEWVRAIRSAGGLDRAGETRRGPQHILPDPGKTSGCKRLLLYLRWMVRPDDGVDLGVWKHVSPSLLLIPVDTHLYKLSRNLGFTERATLTWATTEEVTGALRRLDASDPARFDFPLCHLGMLQRCPSRRDEKRCEGCGIKAVCRHWSR
jgi:uncharacterized protein (TIGR02757 family)